MGESVGQWEWIILMLAFLGLLLLELRSVRRSIARAKQDKKPEN